MFKLRSLGLLVGTLCLSACGSDDKDCQLFEYGNGVWEVTDTTWGWCGEHDFLNELSDFKKKHPTLVVTAIGGEGGHFIISTESRMSPPAK